MGSAERRNAGQISLDSFLPRRSPEEIVRKDNGFDKQSANGSGILERPRQPVVLHHCTRYRIPARSVIGTMPAGFEGSVPCQSVTHRTVTDIIESSIGTSDEMTSFIEPHSMVPMTFLPGYATR